MYWPRALATGVGRRSGRGTSPNQGHDARPTPHLAGFDSRRLHSNIQHHAGFGAPRLGTLTRRRKFALATCKCGAGGTGAALSAVHAAFLMRSQTARVTSAVFAVPPRSGVTSP